MMTIKEFASLCGCSTQTLRYYDKIDLLKPVKVNQSSGYNYCFCFKLTEEKYSEQLEFPVFMIVSMLPRVDNNELSMSSMSCMVERSDDGQNHFVLLRKKEK